MVHSVSSRFLEEFGLMDGAPPEIEKGIGPLGFRWIGQIQASRKRIWTHFHWQRIPLWIRAQCAIAGSWRGLIEQYPQR